MGEDGEGIGEDLRPRSRVGSMWLRRSCLRCLTSGKGLGRMGKWGWMGQEALEVDSR